MNHNNQNSQYELTRPYIKNASGEVLQAMYDKIHNFLGDQRYYYKKATVSDFASRKGEVLLKNVFENLLTRLQHRKKKHILEKHAKGKIQHISADMLHYTGTDALRDLLGLIPVLEAHPDIFEKRITKYLSDEERKYQHTLVPKHIRCVTGTKRLLETILSAKNNIFPIEKTSAENTGISSIPLQQKETPVQLDLLHDLFPKTLSEPDVLHIVGNPKTHQASSSFSPEEKTEIYKTLNDNDDENYQYGWQKYNNR